MQGNDTLRRLSLDQIQILQTLYGLSIFFNSWWQKQEVFYTSSEGYMRDCKLDFESIYFTV